MREWFPKTTYFYNCVEGVSFVPTPRDAKDRHGLHLSFLLAGDEVATRQTESEITLLPFLLFSFSLRHCGQDLHEHCSDSLRQLEPCHLACPVSSGSYTLCKSNFSSCKIWFFYVHTQICAKPHDHENSYSGLCVISGLFKPFPGKEWWKPAILRSTQDTNEEITTLTTGVFHLFPLCRWLTFLHHIKFQLWPNHFSFVQGPVCSGNVCLPLLQHCQNDGNFRGCL